MPSEHAIPSSRRSGSATLWLAVLYGALIVYGTLFPLWEWTFPPLEWANPITAPWPRSPSRTDLLVNVLAYAPLGLLTALWLRLRTNLLIAVVLAVSLGSALSFALETLQSALPSRVPSPLDWIANTAGAAMGAFVATALDPRSAAGRSLRQLREAWFIDGALANLALTILALWAFTQIAPFVPSLDVGNLRSGLKPIAHTLRDPSTFDTLRAAESALQILALGLLVHRIERRAALWLFAAFSLAVLVYKVPAVGRQLTLEALAGWAAAIMLLGILRSRSPAGGMAYTAIALPAAYGLSQLEPGTGSALSAINWVPFRGQVGTVGGMLDILETLWPFMALGLMARWASPWRRRPWIMLVGGMLLAVFAFALEWRQQSIPGRFADLTDVAFVVTGWLLPWLFSDIRSRTLPAASTLQTSDPQAGTRSAEESS
ncbi:MAG TPA: VanZ family protein [Thiobacillaceae bacterium]|nr:VanZ family protein [Thiobacillaceae bacterium]